MISRAVINAFDLRFGAKNKRQTSGLDKRIAIQLEPARDAFPQQAALGDADLGAG